MEYLDPTRVVLHFEMPLAELIVDYFDQLKSRSQGYASMDYEELGYRRGEPRQGRHPRQRRAGRRAVADRPPRQGPVGRARPDRAAQGADPAPDVRDPDPGVDRKQRDCARNSPRHAQERACQVLRWRHHPEAEAAREAERGQAADEAGRARSRSRRRRSWRCCGWARAERRRRAPRRTDPLTHGRLDSDPPDADRARPRAAARHAPPRGVAVQRRRVRRRRRRPCARRSGGGSPGTRSGSALVAAIYIVHPSPSTDLALGPGDRGKSIFLGLLYGAVGTAIAMGVALYRYRRLRFPDVWSYPGALLNSVITAIIDEVAFRGAVLGALLLTGLDPTAANVIQAIVYALATRLGAPGRNRWLLVMALGIGLAGGWVTCGHGRDRGRVPRPRRSPGSRCSSRPATPASSCRAAARSRRSRRSDGRRRAGTSSGRGSRRRGTGERAGRSRPAEPRLARARPSAAPLPPVGLYVHFPFCVSLCPYCDFVVVAGAATRGPTNRIAAFVAALRAEIALRADALDAALRTSRARGRARRSRPSISAAGRRRCCRPTTSRACSTLIRRAVRRRRRRRDHDRGEPRAGRARRRGGPGPGRDQPDLVRRPEPGPPRSSGASGGAIAPPTSADAVAEARDGGHRLDQPGPAVRRPGRLASTPGSTRSRRRSTSSRTTCRSTP